MTSAEVSEARSNQIPESVARFARLCHGAGAVAALGVLILVAIRHEAPMSSAQLITFYGVPATALAFFGLGVASRPAVRINLLLTAFSVGLAVVLAEGVLRFSPAPQQWEGVAAELGDPDPRSKLDVVTELRAEGRHAFPELSPWALRGREIGLAELSGVPIAPAPSHALVVACNEAEGWLEYQSDGYGFRSAAGNNVGDTTAVLVIGDSFAFGQCVSEEATIAGRLRTRWPATRNYGVSGSGPLHQLAVLREYGTRTRPSTVVWVYYEGNDLADLRDEARNPSLARYLEPGYEVGLAERQGQLDPWMEGLLDSIYAATVESQDQASPSGGLRSFLRLDRVRGVLGLNVRFPTEDPLSELPQILRLGNELVRSWDGRLVLVYLPAHRRFRGLGAEGLPGYAEYLAAADEIGVSVVDLAEAFAEDSDTESLWVHPRGHLSRRGYELAADHIAAELAR